MIIGFIKSFDPSLNPIFPNYINSLIGGIFGYLVIWSIIFFYKQLRNKEGITKIRGKWVDMEFGKLKVPTLPSFHPAFLLRQPAQKKYSWEDLKKIRDKIKDLKLKI